MELVCLGRVSERECNLFLRWFLETPQKQVKLKIMLIFIYQLCCFWEASPKTACEMFQELCNEKGKLPAVLFA